LDADLDRFAQLRPGDAFQFRLVTAEATLSHARMIGGMRARWLELLAQRS
jgi:allophanate hydrolase subunit 2